MFSYDGKLGQYNLAQSYFSSGGEGAIYDITSHPGFVAKIYNSDRITPELEQKICYMVNHKPNDSVLKQIAWPQDILYDKTSHFAGFIMEKLKITNELSDLYKYPSKNSAVTTEGKIIVAHNIAFVISEIHSAGYIFGDFNPRNIGIDINKGLVAFLDTDSYHIINQTANKEFRCNVAFDGYVAPELLEKFNNARSQNPNTTFANMPLDTFTTDTDNFALAVHIFKLLMNGYTPFNGIKEGVQVSQAAPGVGNIAILRDNYCFKAGKKPLSPATPPIKSLPNYIGDLFTRAFITARKNPKLRPSAFEWRGALEHYLKEIKKCGENPGHFYYNQLKDCPYCKADINYASQTSGQPKSTGGQKTFTGQSILLNRVNPVVNNKTKRQKNIRPIIYFTITIILSTLLSWILATFAVPVILEHLISKDGGLISFLRALAPYVVFIGGLYAYLYYNFGVSNSYDIKDIFASVFSTGAGCVVTGVIMSVIIALLISFAFLIAIIIAGYVLSRRN
jgi:DNA-binding helix-hairpin-helix protein with protein kinase domain